MKMFAIFLFTLCRVILVDYISNIVRNILRRMHASGVY